VVLPKKVIPGNADVSIYEIMERCSLNDRQVELKSYVGVRDDFYFDTLFPSRGKRLKNFDIPAYKIGSD
jgi:N-acetylneuraminate synthase